MSRGTAHVLDLLPRTPAAPRLRPGTVPRAALVRRLVATREQPIVLAAAPAGYGKTTLLAEWAARDERPFTWFTLSPGAGTGAAVRTAEEATESGRPRVIVADDVHHATPEAIGALLRAGAQLPRGSVLALACRTGPPAPIARLRAHGLVVELAAADLALSRMEAAMVLDAAGLRLRAAQVDHVLERTRGWPAALSLAALALQDGVDSFDGADHDLAEYLRAEVLAGLSEAELTFLRRVSILDTLSPALCDAVAATRGSGAVLRRLVSAGVPIERLDRRDAAFRLHPLLAGMLRAELESGRRRSLHRRAAVWQAREGDAEAAVGHAVACRDAALAGRLAWSLAPACAARGEEARLRAWLEHFTAGEILAHPPLALTSALSELARGNRIAAERAAAAAEGEPAAALIRACIAREGVRQMAADAARARRQAPAGSGFEAVALLLEGVARQLAGEPARERLEEAAARGIEPVAAIAQVQLALLAADADGWDEAERALSEVPPPALEPARALVLAATAAVAAQRGEIARARRDAADAAALLAEEADGVPWLLAEAHVWLARAAIRLSDGPVARGLLTRAARLQSLLPGAVVLSRWVHDGWARADAFAASATGDGPMLTNAELRVLRLLESCMSFREIGERLHVSPNTVKTQALSVYRKLDVSCRSDAVSRGRVAGLIGS